MIYAALLFGLMVAVQLFFARDLPGYTRVRYWLAYTLVGFVVGYLMHHPFVATLLQAAVMMAFFVAAFTASSRAGGV